MVAAKSRSCAMKRLTLGSISPMGGSSIASRVDFHTCHVGRLGNGFLHSGVFKREFVANQRVLDGFVGVEPNTDALDVVEGNLSANRDRFAN